MPGSPTLSPCGVGIGRLMALFGGGAGPVGSRVRVERLAEGVGFEPTVAVTPHTLSKRAESAALASLPGCTTVANDHDAPKGSAENAGHRSHRWDVGGETGGDPAVVGGAGRG